MSGARNQDTWMNSARDQDAGMGNRQRCEVNGSQEMTDTTLPADVARCSGYETDEGDLREGCSDCLRRTDRSNFPQQVWTAPPALIVFECELRIAP